MPGGIPQKYSEEAKAYLRRCIDDEGMSYKDAIAYVEAAIGESIPYESARKIVQALRANETRQKAREQATDNPVRDMTLRMLSRVEKELAYLEKKQPGKADLDDMQKLAAILERLDKLSKTNRESSKPSEQVTDPTLRALLQGDLDAE